MFWNKYPYTNFHELNLDWVIGRMKVLIQEWDEFKQVNSITWAGLWDITKQYVAWSVVRDKESVYISIKPVPAGISIENSDYWTKLVDYTAVYVTPEMFGAAGDGVKDDTEFIQKAIETRIPVYIGQKYLVTDTIDLNENSVVFGCGNVDRDGESADTKVSIVYADHTGEIFNLLPDHATFSKVTLKGFTVYSKQENNVGVYTHRASHLLLEDMAFQNFKDGIAVKFGAGGGVFGGQYSDVVRCFFDHCKTGIQINDYNGVNVIDCMFDCNRNGSEINDYTNGVFPGSIAIDQTGGSTSRFTNDRFQGYDTCLNLAGIYNSVLACRFEMFNTALDISGDKNNVSSGNTFNNYLLLTKNGQPLTGRYGNIFNVTGEQITIGEIYYGSVNLGTLGTKTTGAVKKHLMFPIFAPAGSSAPFLYQYDPYFIQGIVTHARIVFDTNAQIPSVYSDRLSAIVTGAGSVDIFDLQENYIDFANYNGNVNQQIRIIADATNSTKNFSGMFIIDVEKY